MHEATEQAPISPITWPGSLEAGLVRLCHFKVLLFCLHAGPGHPEPLLGPRSKPLSCEAFRKPIVGIKSQVATEVFFSEILYSSI